jgi:hypothetical protein
MRREIKKPTRRDGNELIGQYKKDEKGPGLIPDPGPLFLAESSAGLGIPLTPVQRLIVSLIGESRGYHSLEKCDEAVDANELEKLLGLNDESPRLWLPPDARINKKSGSPKIEFDSPITLLLCVAGRRSGTTTVASILMSWLAWLILRNPDFLSDVPLLPSSIVSLLNAACDTAQSKILFRMLMSNLTTLGLIEEDSATSETARIGRLLIESLSSSARSSRGRTACGVCLDEFAHFQRTSGPLADRTIWTALIPSLATFGPKSLAVITTSPAGRSGVVWELFRRRGDRAGMLTVQLPTWVMNPNVPREKLEDEFTSDENLSRQEYGAEFLAPHGRFLRLDEIRACVGTVEPPKGKVARRMHVDLGLRHDATAIAVGRVDHGEDDTDWRIVIERVETMQADSTSALNVGEIEALIRKIADEHGVKSITFDQHESTYLIQRLNPAGYSASVVPATAKSNHEVFSYLHGLISNGQIILPDHARLIDELGSLECTPTWYGYRVEAPSGMHDDCADAVAVVAWCLARDAGGQDWIDFMNVVESR